MELDPAVRPTISVDEAAIVLGVSRDTVYAAVREGTVPSLRLTGSARGRIRIPTAPLLRLLGLAGALSANRAWSGNPQNGPEKDTNRGVGHYPDPGHRDSLTPASDRTGTGSAGRQ